MKVIRWIDRHLEEYILVSILAYISVATGLQVYMRHVAGSSLVWTEESIRYLFIWMVFIGFSLGVKHDKHISIFVVYNLFSNRIKIWFKVVANVIFLCFGLIVAYVGFETVQSFMEFKQSSPVLGIPMHYVYAAAPIGLGLTSIRLIQNTVQVLRLYQLERKSASSIESANEEG